MKKILSANKKKFLTVTESEIPGEILLTVVRILDGQAHDVCLLDQIGIELLIKELENNRR